jgi:hypothetical protein
MPALLGYLIAVVVFLGSGYAGLEWLTSPDDPITHQASKRQQLAQRWAEETCW